MLIGIPCFPWSHVWYMPGGIMLDSAVLQIPSSGQYLLRTPTWEECGHHPGNITDTPASAAQECPADGNTDTFHFCLFCKIEISCTFSH